jgi:hypothetical protein
MNDKNIWFITEKEQSSNSVYAVNESMGNYFKFTNVGGATIGDNNLSMFTIVDDQLYMRVGQDEYNNEPGNVYIFDKDYT